MGSIISEVVNSKMTNPIIFASDRKLGGTDKYSEGQAQVTNSC